MPSTNNLSTVNLQEIFNLTDKKGRGSIEANKIGDLLRYSGLNPTERACSQIIGNSNQLNKTLQHYINYSFT